MVEQDARRHRRHHESLIAVTLAAMSGIIGGEVVLLGLIALPQMLRQRV